MREQVAYQNERAAEYDEPTWPGDGRFEPLIDEAVAALRSLGPVERAIELGTGTEQFTGVLAEMADHLTAVDSSPNMLALLCR